jgi:hypothetical protein
MCPPFTDQKVCSLISMQIFVFVLKNNGNNTVNSKWTRAAEHEVE